MPVKVLIYEDNQALLSSIKTLFQWHDEFEVVAGMPNALSVVTDIERFKPDVILMDIDMPPDNGVEAIKKLRQRFADIPVIMLTVFEDNDNIVNSICAGANGYLLKKDVDQVLPAIKDVLGGGAPMTSTVARKVLQLFTKTQPSQAESPDSLTKREAEILQWLVKGFSYKMIAAELNLGLETVRSHIKKIYKKLHASSATEAIYKAHRYKSI
jgi:DNA-binding NarL/FixJ family response regulator